MADLIYTGCTPATEDELRSFTLKQALPRYCREATLKYVSLFITLVMLVYLKPVLSITGLTTWWQETPTDWAPRGFAPKKLCLTLSLPLTIIVVTRFSTKMASIVIIGHGDYNHQRSFWIPDSAFLRDTVVLLTRKALFEQSFLHNKEIKERYLIEIMLPREANLDQ